MPSGQLWIFAGSLLAVLLLVLVSAWLRLGREVRIADEAEARELADNAVCGFEAVEIDLDKAGRGALLRDADARILLLAPHGARFAARLLGPAVRAERDGTKLTILTGEASFPRTTLDLGASAGAWDMRLTSLYESGKTKPIA